MGKLRLKGRVTELVRVNKEPLDGEQVSIPGVHTFEDGEVHSRVSVKLGYLKSKGWQTVSMDVTVELPSPLGRERATLKAATELADGWLRENEEAVADCLRELS